MLADIPLPMVHTAFGLAVAAAEVALRPETVGLNRSAAADAGLAILTGLILVAYDFLVYPSDSRPGPVGTALPMAAVALVRDPARDRRAAAPRSGSRVA